MRGLLSFSCKYLHRQLPNYDEMLVNKGVIALKINRQKEDLKKKSGCEKFNHAADAYAELLTWAVPILKTHSLNKNHSASH
ncbi:hypothetical protein [Bacillus atrophaeus]|uniref:hypothetical protein n=1 Tax=Bacillus atrophaeus TaxID=1452 RepID=UPI00227DB8FB|nr:hypothetical protein [Bacillus atrophaeus]MCY8947935.1 hypothetical protein [Bacillus atrophaeus]